MSKTHEQKLYDILDDMSISYKKIEHPAFASCDASGDFYKNNDMGMDCKNIFLRNRRGKKHYIIVLRADKNLNIPHLAEFLEENKKMGFASEERLDKFLSLKPGSVTPFGLISENAKDIPIVVDKDVLECEYIHFHPFRNTASLKITIQDFIKFCNTHACELKIYDTNF
jgi:Ala-tRNA(Pro) deacylase